MLMHAFDTNMLTLKDKAALASSLVISCCSFET